MAANNDKRKNNSNRKSSTASSATSDKDRRDDSKPCGYFGYVHPRGKCPAYNKICNFSKKKGHFSNVCRNENKNITIVDKVDNFEENMESFFYRYDKC